MLLLLVACLQRLFETCDQSGITALLLLKLTCHRSVERVSVVVALHATSSDVASRKVEILLCSESTASELCPVGLKKVAHAASRRASLP